MTSFPDFSGASWIASTVLGSPRVSPPAPYLRKPFALPAGIRSARLVATALGLYECEINGQRVGDSVFAPGWTEYSKRVQYQTYDVTSLLRSGDNVLGAILGDGWYCGYVAWKPRQTYGDRPRFLARLEIVLEDGSSVAIVSDGSWKTSTGPILENDILGGESYDARQELGNWSEPGYNDAAWQPVLIMPDPEIELTLSPGPPVRRMGEVTPISVKKTKFRFHDNSFVYDLGQNFSGRARITVEGSPGMTVILQFVEMLTAEGKPYTDNIREAGATDIYTCKGNGPETWEPRFTFHGFRYVVVTGSKSEEQVKVTGIVLYSDMKTTGHFACSNPLVNQLQSNILWGQKSNFIDIPTDCPQRDERMGWTGDAQVFIRTAAFNMNVRTFFHKWFQDMRDAQQPNGGMPPVIPNQAMNMEDGGPAWSDATIICPWTIYLCYNDKSVLESQYDSMAGYMNFMEKERCKDYIRSHPDVDKWGGFGDWLALDGSGITEGITPKDLIGTAFYAYDASIMARVATLLERHDDAQKYTDLHGKIVEAFGRRFITPDGLMVAGTQTSYVLALHFGLLPEKARAQVADQLARHVEKKGNHLATGFVGTPYILDVLEGTGRLDLAYKLLEQETFPSWLFPVKNGATTIWERWDGWTPEKGFQDKGMNSFNHYAYGAVGDWMVHSVAGLELDPTEPGYRHVIFRPRPGGTITWAEASLETAQGLAAIRWDLEEGNLRITLTVPKDSRASLSLPEGYKTETFTDLLSGTHSVVARKG